MINSLRSELCLSDLIDNIQHNSECLADLTLDSRLRHSYIFVFSHKRLGHDS